MTTPANSVTQTQRLCVYGVARRHDAILLVRASSLTEVPGMWFLPGGGVDHGEHPEEALVREVKEETGLSATVGKFLGVLSDVRTRKTGTDHHSVRLIYELHDLDGRLVDEAQGSSDQAKWISFSDARQLTLARYVVSAARLCDLDLSKLQTAHS